MENKRLMVRLVSVNVEGDVKLKREDGKTFTVGDDCYCSVARYYGWKACPECDDTDGSVACLHRSTAAMLSSAFSFLHDHVGDVTDDPGWWTE